MVLGLDSVFRAGFVPGEVYRMCRSLFASFFGVTICRAWNDLFDGVQMGSGEVVYGLSDMEGGGAPVSQ